MKIYVVRHGQVNSNINKIYNIKDEDLNQTGIKQAEELKEKIKDMDFDIIYCSPLLRATHTANIINSRNKEIIIDNRLEERDAGELIGKPLESTNREEYWNYYSNIKYGTEETIKEFIARVYNFIDELKSKEYNNVLIVAHTAITRAFYTYFNGMPKDGNILNLGLKNGEMKEYELKNEEKF